MTINSYGIVLSIISLFFIFISLKIIKLRHLTKTLIGYSSENPKLENLIYAQKNFVEYSLFFLLLLHFFSLQIHLPWSTLAIGIIFLIGRVIHFVSLTVYELQDPPYFKYRVLGMQITIWSIIVIAVANIGFIFVKVI